MKAATPTFGRGVPFMGGPTVEQLARWEALGGVGMPPYTKAAMERAIVKLENKKIAKDAIDKAGDRGACGELDATTLERCDGRMIVHYETIAGQVGFPVWTCNKCGYRKVP